MRQLWLTVAVIAILAFAGAVLPLGAATIATPDLSIKPQIPHEGGADWYKVTLAESVTFNAIYVRLEFLDDEIKVLQFSDTRTIIEGWSYTENIQGTMAEYYAYSDTSAEGIVDDILLFAQLELLKAGQMRKDDRATIKTLVRLDEKKYETTSWVALDLTYGDISGDGTASSFDAATVLQWLVGVENQWTGYLNTRWGQQMAEVSADGSVTEYDASLMLQEELDPLFFFFPIEAAGTHPAPAAYPPKAAEISVRSVRLGSNQWEVLVDAKDAPAVAGYLEFWVPEFVRAQEIEQGTIDAMMSFHQKEEALKVCFAQPHAISNNGELLSIAVSTRIPMSRLPFVLKEVRLDEGRIQVKILPQELTIQEWQEILKRFTFQAVPAKTVLLQNYPNPLNPETWIPYQLAEATDVVIKIYDSGGKLVKELDLGFQFPGYYVEKAEAAYWDGRNTVGEPVASGVYFYNIQAGESFATRKMLLLK